MSSPPFMNNFTVHDHSSSHEIPFPLFSHSDNFEDNEDKNLSWLFNFKIDEIANLSPEIKRKRSNNSNNSSNNSNNHHQQQTAAATHHSFSTNHQQLQLQTPNHQQQLQQPQQIVYEEQNQKSCIEDDLNVAENVVISNAATFITPT